MRRLKPVKLLKRDFQSLHIKLGDDPDGEVLTVDEKQLCVEKDRLEGAMEHEESFLPFDKSYADNECKGTDINEETLCQEPS